MFPAQASSFRLRASIQTVSLHQSANRYQSAVAEVMSNLLHRLHLVIVEVLQFLLGRGGLASRATRFDAVLQTNNGLQLQLFERGGEPDLLEKGVQGHGIFNSDSALRFEVFCPAPHMPLGLLHRNTQVSKVRDGYLDETGIGVNNLDEGSVGILAALNRGTNNGSIPVKESLEPSGFETIVHAWMVSQHTHEMQGAI